MPVYKLQEIEPELVTPRHSPALGRVITGESIEMAVADYREGKGPNRHSHPHEQMVFIASGRVTFEIEGEEAEVFAGEVIHVPANRWHVIIPLEDSRLVSVKNLVDGVAHKLS